MKKVTISEGLVDKLIFEAYKNTPLESIEKFKKRVQKDYGVTPNYDLYRKLNNYQIQKYGRTIQPTITYHDKFEWGRLMRKARQRKCDRKSNRKRVRNES